MGTQVKSMERGIASMAFWPRCGLQLPRGQFILLQVRNPGQGGRADGSDCFGGKFPTCAFRRRSGRAARCGVNAVTNQSLNRALAIRTSSPRGRKPEDATTERRTLTTGRSARIGRWETRQTHYDLGGTTARPRPVNSGQTPPLGALAVEPPSVPIGQLGETVAVLMSQNAAQCEIAEPRLERTPTVSQPRSVHAGRKAAAPARSKKNLPFILICGVVGLGLALGTLAGMALIPAGGAEHTHKYYDKDEPSRDNRPHP